MIEVGLILARFLHYAATTSLAGLTFFPVYAYLGNEPEALASWRRRWVLWTAAVAFLSGLCWFTFVAANMSGDIGDLADLQMLNAVVQGTDFGRVWTMRMLLAVIIVGLAARDVCSNSLAHRRNWTMPLLSAVLLASLAGTGHAQIEEGWAGVTHVIADAAHLLAAGAWLGGLIPLALILRHAHGTPSYGHAKEVDSVLLRFSGMGYVAVAMLIGSGLVNGWLLVGSVSGLWDTSYGLVLLGKLALFGAMLALAAMNRFWLVPAMGKAAMDPVDEGTKWSARLRKHVLGEQLLGMAVLLAVSVLGTMQPAVGQ